MARRVTFPPASVRDVGVGCRKMDPAASPTWTSMVAVNVPEELPEPVPSPVPPVPPVVPPPVDPPVAAVILAVPRRPSDRNVAVAEPFLSTVTTGSIDPRLAVSRTSVPVLSGLPSGLRPITVIVDSPLTPIFAGLALTERIVPLGATGEALSQPTEGIRDVKSSNEAATL